MIFRYCPRCGAELPANATPPNRVLQQTCQVCGAVHYQNAKPCAGALVTREGQVLLGCRATAPFEGWWDIPGGFLEPWEHPRDGAAREVAEETGLIVRTTELLAIFVDTYVVGDAQEYTLNIFYLAEIVGGEERPGDDLAALGWFGSQDLPPDIAFDNGPKALQVWRERVEQG